jgi:hypothetical protein
MIYANSERMHKLGICYVEDICFILLELLI